MRFFREVLVDVARGGGVIGGTAGGFDEIGGLHIRRVRSNWLYFQYYILEFFLLAASEGHEGCSSVIKIISRAEYYSHCSYLYSFNAQVAFSCWRTHIIVVPRRNRMEKSDSALLPPRNHRSAHLSHPLLTPRCRQP